jgi:glycosyltransferase involved in cell wall biosynthesis
MLKLFDEVHVISPRDTEKYDLKNKNIIVHSINPAIIKYLSPYKEAKYLKKLIKTKNIKVIRALATSSGYVALRASKGKIPVVVSMHTHSRFYSPHIKTSIIKKIIMNRLEPIVYRRADLIPIVSEFCGERVKEIGGDESKLFLHYNWVDTKLFKPIKHQLNRGKKILLYVGRMSSEKGVDFIIKAMPEILRRRQDILLKIGGDGPEIENLKQLASDLKVSDSVEFLGRIEHETELPKLYQTSDVLIGSISAGFSLIEGMACGLPAVCGNVEWHPEVIQDGINGYLTNPYSPEDFAKAIIKALNPSTYNQMSKNARKLAVERFDLKRWKQRELEIYRRALNENTRFRK